jgi:hypothetical protein
MLFLDIYPYLNPLFKSILKAQSPDNLKTCAKNHPIRNTSVLSSLEYLSY